MMASVMFMTSTGVVNAATETYFQNTGTSYLVHSLTTTKIGDKSKKLDALGINKKSYTSGCITVTKSQAHTFSASMTVTGEYSWGFASVSASLEVGASYTAEVSAGTTINLESSAPNGVYYAYVCVPHVKATYKCQYCTLSYSGWYTKKTQDIAYMPMVNMEYLEIKKVY